MLTSVPRVRDWNYLEITVLPTPIEELSEELQVIPVHMDKNTWQQWQRRVAKFKDIRIPRPYDLHEYYAFDLVDQYDPRSDTHRVLQKHAEHEFLKSNLHGVFYKQDVLPEYRFPNTRELSCTATRKRIAIRHTNRISIMFDETSWPMQKEPVYTMQIHVQCPEKVDIEVLQQNLDELLTRLG